MEVQRNGDYILQADILEGDLQPLLQKIQIIFQERDMVQVPDFLSLNMRSLKKENRKLFEVLNAVEEDDTLLEKYQFGIGCAGKHSCWWII